MNSTLDRLLIRSSFNPNFLDLVYLYNIINAILKNAYVHNIYIFIYVIITYYLLLGRNLKIKQSTKISKPNTNQPEYNVFYCLIVELIV